MTFNFITKGNNKAVLGAFYKLSFREVRKYMHTFEKCWIEI